MTKKRILTELTRDEIASLVDRIEEVMSEEFSIANSSINAFWKCLDAGSVLPDTEEKKPVCTIAHDIDEIWIAEDAIEASQDEATLEDTQ